ncbi:MAG: hypothetical protein RLZZ200_107 [Pseudomonadota bacterium]|jgi:hypothetical protein
MTQADPEQYGVAQRQPAELAAMQDRFRRAQQYYDPLGTGLTPEKRCEAFPGFRKQGCF